MKCQEQDDIGASVEAPVLNAPVFKFIWSAMPQDGPRSGSGAVQGGAVGGNQAPGMTMCQVRQITFSNDNASDITCRFRTEGPYRIQLIHQPGHPPVQGSSASPSKRKEEKSEVDGRLFVLAKWDTITLHVVFNPELIPASKWHHYQMRHEHVFLGLALQVEGAKRCTAFFHFKVSCRSCTCPKPRATQHQVPSISSTIQRRHKKQGGQSFCFGVLLV